MLGNEKFYFYKFLINLLINKKFSISRDLPVVSARHKAAGTNVLVVFQRAARGRAGDYG